MKQFLTKTSEIILFSFLGIFPFSYENVTNQWTILFLLASLALIGLHFLRGKTQFNFNIIGIVYAVLFMLLFDFAEKVNFIYQFNIPVEITKRIPLSTVLLVIGMLALLMKTLIEGKVKIINHPFTRFFLFACAFLVSLMILFYPFLYYHYKMQPASDIQLLNKIFKYLMLSLLVMDYLSDEKKFRIMNLGFIFSLSLTIILSIIF